MQKTRIEIKEISNGWLLTIYGDDMRVNVEDMYFKTFPEVLAHLHKLDIK